MDGYELIYFIKSEINELETRNPELLTELILDNLSDMCIECYDYDKILNIVKENLTYE